MPSTNAIVRLFSFVYIQASQKFLVGSFGHIVVQENFILETSHFTPKQGDPLGPLLFSLVILQLLDDIGNLPGLLLKLWYLDDGTFVGERKSIALLEKLSSLGPRHGLYINKAKCEVFWPSGDPTFPEFPANVHRVVASTGGA